MNTDKWYVLDIFVGVYEVRNLRIKVVESPIDNVDLHRVLMNHGVYSIDYTYYLYG